MQKGTPSKSELDAELVRRVLLAHQAKSPHRNFVKQAIFKDLRSLGTSLTNFLDRLKYGDLDPAAVRDPNFKKVVGLYRKGHWGVTMLLANPNFYKAISAAKQTSLEGTDKWWLAVLAGIFEVRKPLMEGAKSLVMPKKLPTPPPLDPQTLKNRRKRQRRLTRRPSSSRVRVGGLILDSSGMPSKWQSR